VRLAPEERGAVLVQKLLNQRDARRRIERRRARRAAARNVATAAVGVGALGLALVFGLFLAALAAECSAPPCPRGWNSERREGVLYCVVPETSLHPGVSR